MILWEPLKICADRYCVHHTCISSYMYTHVHVQAKHIQCTCTTSMSTISVGLITQSNTQPVQFTHWRLNIHQYDQLTAFRDLYSSIGRITSC